VLAVTTGMRQGELVGLMWKDVDLDAGTLKVSRSVYESVVSPPKTNAGRRTIRLSKLAVSALQQHTAAHCQQLPAYRLDSAMFSCIVDERATLSR